MGDCPYCKEEYQSSERNILENESWIANFDGHPVNPGHMKIISKRHVVSISELNNEELISMREMMKKVESLGEEQFKTDEYNWGFNKGKNAGQTKFHLHIHYIPRYEGDVEDPIGGVRNIIPEKGNYLKLKK